MAQKDKVKELVGRGLNSYHTKTLQQIDRIEKKNKEQNHKISILTNELDNDYLTKTEEGSVVSLEHSKEGMVYLDELQGNTLVNYCTDGSKELTLNGDIDLEGTFVTTTEGVDGGKVDVMCEGNTLVNLKLNSGEKCGVSWQNSNTVNYFTLSENSSIHLKGEIIETSNVLQFGWCYAKLGKFNTKLLKPNTTYTIILDNHYDWLRVFSLMEGNATNATNAYHKSGAKISKNIYTVTTKDNFEGLNDEHIILYGSIDGNYKGNVDCSVVAMLEGDWSNKELPNVYFEGMKSVGQDDENGHKIEILSQNKNLLKNTSLSTKTSWYTFNGTIIDGVNDNKGIYSEYTPTSTGYYDFLQQDIFSRDNINNTIKNNKWYTFSFYAKGTGKVRTHIYPRVIDKTIKGFVDGIEKTLLDDGNYDWSLTNEWVRHSYTFKTKSDISDMGTYGKILFRLMPSDTDVLNTVTISCPMLEEGKVITNFTNDLFNKKEILLNEPLRGIDNLKDKLVKIGGKWYIERNCGTDTFDGSDDENWTIGNANGTENHFKTNTIKDSKQTTNIPLKCDKVNVTTHNVLDEGSGYGINLSYYLRINLPNCDVKNGATVDDLKQYLQQNPITIVYQLATPIYEPLEIEPTLNTYTDITHISNTSIIPCNMKIKNSGYNAIIKPSTLYTIALDTNKSGTIGMNLGGTKGTTTNNVLKLTTPATLTDDSLRLYGKDIKGSKVRLLEGDKTNWIPSHFEGMQSSFEDKLQEDGTYKMEILSNNRNLFSPNGVKMLDITSTHKIEVTPTGYIVTSKSTHQGWAYSTIDISKLLKPNTTYKLSCKITKNNNNTKPAIRVFRFLDNKDYGMIHDSGEVTFTTPSCGVGYLRLLIYSSIDNVISNENDFIKYEDIQISEIKSDFIMKEYNKIQFSSIEPLRKWDRFVFKDGQLTIERRTLEKALTKDMPWSLNATVVDKNSTQFVCRILPTWGCSPSNEEILCDKKTTKNINSGSNSIWVYDKTTLVLQMRYDTIKTIEDLKAWLDSERPSVQLPLTEPTYEEIPFELQKIILEGYENGTLFFDTNIPPTSTVTYAGETPIVKATKLNKTEVLSNTNDINDNIVPYLMDMDYRVVCLQLESNIEGISMARLFGGVYEMLKRDILSKRLTKEEYGYRLIDYFNTGKLTEEEVRELEDLR